MKALASITNTTTAVHLAMEKTKVVAVHNNNNAVVHNLGGSGPGLITQTNGCLLFQTALFGFSCQIWDHFFVPSES